MSNVAVMSQNYAIGEFLHACNEMKCMLAHPSMSKPASLACSQSVGRSVGRGSHGQIYLHERYSTVDGPSRVTFYCGLCLCNGRNLDVNSNSNATAAAAASIILVMWR